MSQDKPPLQPGPPPPPPLGLPQESAAKLPPPATDGPDLGPSVGLLQPKPPGKKLLLSTVLLALAAAGLGYYSFTLLQAQRGTAQALSERTRAVEGLRARQHTQQAQVGTLKKEKAEITARSTEVAAQLELSQTKLAAVESRLDELEEERSEIDARMREFQKVARSFKRMVDSGKLSVKFRRGRMVVELPAKVLFASGSAELSEDGRSALKEVAKVLRKVPGKRFIVGGHTDNVPIRTRKSKFSSNWALSSARSVMVTEALVRSGLRAGRLVAAGYGPYDPIAGNGGKAGRQKNRRIEIILEPKVRELPRLGRKSDSAKKSATK